MRMTRRNVLIKPITVQEAYNGALVLPEDTGLNPEARGKVLSVGPDVSEVDVGDTVYFEVFDWVSAPEDCIILAEGEILAKEGPHEHVPRNR